jgi:hypothetical protein
MAGKDRFQIKEVYLPASVAFFFTLIGFAKFLTTTS